MDWFDLLEVQGTLKSLLQHHSSKALILRCSTFIMLQLSHLYMTTGKTIALPTFVGKVMSLIFNTLYWFVKAFLPRSKHPFSLYSRYLSWMQPEMVLYCLPFAQATHLWATGNTYAPFTWRTALNPTGPLIHHQ